ncbi:MAG: 16S rRNA (cytidine(1402)-2'-O)-methyltransferase [Eubacterium sp.]|nr:16S rRNA (cytidine(1402)-2'-O)-methyltransferase [Eubacterium sp.]
MLYLCATPIGNLGDISERVIETLKAVDVIAAEDTRQTIKLLNHFDIKKQMIAYHEHNRYEMTPVLVERMLAGEDIALVTDAGTPAISDPGEDLVRACREAGVAVTSLPGATAFTTALTLSGMSARRFTFEGFLPQDKKEQRAVLERLRDTTVTTIFYEAPHRLVKTLEVLAEAVGAAAAGVAASRGSAGADGAPGEAGSGVSRAVTVCKELTKKHEWSMRFDSLADAVAYFTDVEEPRGEFVLVIEGCDREELEAREKQAWQEMTLDEHMEIYLSQGIEKKEAMRLVAKDRGVSKREVYQALLKN